MQREIFSEKMKSFFSFQQPATCIKKEEEDDSKIKIISEKEITSLVLLGYLHQRKILADLAGKYCRQVDYELYGKTTMRSVLKTVPEALNYATKNLRQAALQKTLHGLKMTPKN